MEELLLKYVELGALGIFSLLLLTRGLSALNTLSDSQRTLASAVDKLADKINLMDSRVSDIERELSDIKRVLTENTALIRSFAG